MTILNYRLIRAAPRKTENNTNQTNWFSEVNRELVSPISIGHCDKATQYVIRKSALSVLDREDSKLKFRSSKRKKNSRDVRSLILRTQGDDIQLKTANEKCIHSIIDHGRNGLA